MISLSGVRPTPFLVPAPAFRHPRVAQPLAAHDVVSPFATAGAGDAQGRVSAPVEASPADAAATSSLGPWQRAGSALMVALSLSGPVSGALAAERVVPEPPRPGISQLVVARSASSLQLFAPSVVKSGGLALAVAPAPAVVQPTAPAPSVAQPAAPTQAAPAPESKPSVSPIPLLVGTPFPVFAAKPADLRAHDHGAGTAKQAHARQGAAHGTVSGTAKHAPSHGVSANAAVRPAAHVNVKSEKHPAKTVGDHPISDVVNHYVASHHMGDSFLVGHVQRSMRVGALAGTAGMAAATATAMHGAHAAVALGAHAQAVGAAAKAAHSAVGMAQAAQMGTRAAHIGTVAKAAAGIAAPLSIVGGALAVFDGGIGIYQRQKTVDNIHELQQVAQKRMHQLRRQGKVTRAVERDYARVQAQLARAEHHARAHQAFGAAKVVFGGMMIAAPFTGPAAPIVGGVGAVGYVATTVAEMVYEHYEEAPEAPNHGRGQQTDSGFF